MIPDEALVGWRAWNLVEGTDGPELMPSGAGVGSWPPGRAVEARCGVPALLRPRRRDHTVPEPGCRCGIYASRTIEGAFERRRPAWPPAPVVGRVSLWGRTVEHDLGWRARFAYPVRLRLACAICIWMEPGSATPAVVHRFAGRLYPLCGEHAPGIEVPGGRRTNATPIDPAVLQDRLLGTYAVDLLPPEPVATIAGRAPAPTVDPWYPSIRALGSAG